MDRGAIAVWDGAKVKAGTVTTDSGALSEREFSPVARFEREARAPATTPEELLAAAFASCFTMTFAEQLAAAGHSPSSLRTEVRVQLVKPRGHWEIPAIRVHCSAGVAGISETEFLAIAHAVRDQSPIARALRAEITLTVSLDRAPGREWQASTGLKHPST